MEPFYTIIIVCLNPGDKLKSTLESVEEQTFHDFEVIVKDGLSDDGSLSYACDLQKVWEKAGVDDDMRQYGRTLKIIQKKDTGIYDAMNQAAEEARGKYIYYLNCGDRFATKTVLAEMGDCIAKKHKTDGCKEPAKGGIFYGDIFERLTGQRVASNPCIDAFACYRNVPCHQACFYSKKLLQSHPFEIKYKVRADYEQFLWCFFQGGAEFFHTEIIIADYEGGGFSESKENKKVSAREHKEITGKYIPLGQLVKFRLIMLLTLSSLRTYLAENEKTAGVYNRIKLMLYRLRKS